MKRLTASLLLLLALACGGPAEPADDVTTGAPLASAAAPQPLGLPANPRVLLVGDSYSEGIGAVPLSKGYAYQIAAPLGWTLTRDGIGGSGYVNPGPKNQGRYADRLWAHPADGYDLVMLQGGSNDQKWDSATVAGSVNETIRTVKKRYPSARILLLGPASPYGSADVERIRINDIVKRYAALYAIPFVDPIAEQWFVSGDGALCANPDNGHPSNAGHAIIAKLFIRAYRNLERCQ